MATALATATMEHSFPDVRRVDGRTCKPEDALRILREDGAVIVEYAISPAQADRIVAEMAPWIGGTTSGVDDFSGKNTVRCGALPARSPTFNEAVLKNRFLRAAADEHLLEHAKRYQLHVAQIIKIGPGSPAQPLHRDRVAWGKHLPEELEPMVATMWALSDFTDKNGATQVVPGTHARPLNSYMPDAEGRDVRQAVMPKGSCVLYLGSTIHGGGANVTKDDWRVGMHVSFSLGWLRSEENHYLSVPPEVARTLDPEVQELVGYAMMDHSMGYYSPATSQHTPPVKPEKFEDMPYGSDTLAPEFALGRVTRPWDESAGTKKGSGIAVDSPAEGQLGDQKAKL
ncbi:phytanoyl-CoA dioxygenase [Hyaloraphidium curvatum]|nr:phytanoyl-CoA dioxygenase [Hyaloraphidium curvatum]KAI9010054.1 phytanoyl-CoA dioxygenase [Hyaloraphidium curvatum]